MILRRSLVAAAFLFLSCASHQPTLHHSLNKYGLHVVGSVEEYLRSVAANPDNALMEITATDPSIRLDIRYATADNFMKKPLYPVARAFLRRPALLALVLVQSDLQPLGLGLKVFDGYRPYSVTEAMWEPYKQPDFVADPAKGSRHNRGAAVDLTLINRRTGEEVEMPTAYDAFTPAAAQSFMELPPDVVANRMLLREAMMRRGFEPLSSEWWHFDYAGWKQFELMDIPLEDLPAAGAKP